MNKKRLLKLADLLEADAKNKKGIKFDLGTWGEIGNRDNPLSCGTTACAMGLAALSGAFKRCGLKAVYYYGSDLNVETRAGAEDGINSAVEIFGIKEHDARWLFMPSNYDDELLTGAKGERAVAKRIRDFVAGKVLPPQIFELDH